MGNHAVLNMVTVTFDVFYNTNDLTTLNNALNQFGTDQEPLTENN